MHITCSVNTHRLYDEAYINCGDAASPIYPSLPTTRILQATN